jgi:flagellar biosynthetic protein FliR
VDDFTRQVLAILCVSLRIAPALAFAPPFTLVRVPALVRVLMALALAAWMVGTWPARTALLVDAAPSIVVLAMGELLIGIAIALALQLAFAAVLWAGQALDTQAGFGLATVADPTTQAQMPLAGTILAYATAAIFFAGSGPFDLLGVWAASLDVVPLGAAVRPDLGAVATLMGALFGIAVGLAGMVMTTLFLLDIAIAFMSRTLPQMNVLLLGFQVKAIAMLLCLPIAISVSAALFLRLVRLALSGALTLVAAG